MKIREPKPDELAALSELCLRSKAHWGYDRAFMEACRAELTLRHAELRSTQIAIAECDSIAVGLVQIIIDGSQAELLKLFVEPSRIGAGVGRILLNWAIDKAHIGGATRLFIDSDPDAAAFYRRMGAQTIGTARSESIPGRRLPRLAIDL